MQWKTTNSNSTLLDEDDGALNTQRSQEVVGTFPAFEFCIDYRGAGYADWYMPARNELTVIYDNLRNHTEFSDNVASGAFTHSSTQGTITAPWVRRFSDGNEIAAGTTAMTSTTRRTRPIRRVPVNP